MNMKSCLALAVFLTGHGLSDPAAKLIAAPSADLVVEFRDCVESIGITLVSSERARQLVPAGFQLAGEGQPVTPLVVRSARCGGIAVAGHEASAGAIVQIGVIIVPPDFSGDVNLYTLFYYTSDPALARQLARSGTPAQFIPTMDYIYERGGDGQPGSLFVAVPRPGRPQLWLDGSVIESPNAAGSFVANWWAHTGDGIVKMSTSVPEIFVGAANLTLMTPANGPLGHLIEGGSTGFPVLQQFNTFAAADMVVSVR